nr:energy-coupling factor transporter transmembrane component T [Pediococcus acidilactici]
MNSLSRTGVVHVNKILFGRYIPGHSFIHRMDPRAKLILSLVYIVAVFLANSWAAYLASFVLAMVIIAASAIGPRFFWDGVKPLIGVILLTMIIQVFFGVGGHVYWHWGILSITSNGLLNAVYIAIRFILIILVSTVLTLTTSPLEISGAIEAIFMPLKKVHFPVYEMALMLSIALRFVPTLIDETEKILNAQRSRGADFSSGSILVRLKKLVAILIPLFESAFSRAEELATAMESRGYQGGEGRSKYRVLNYTKNDIIGTVTMLLAAVVIIALRR